MTSTAKTGATTAASWCLGAGLAAAIYEDVLAPRWWAAVVPLGVICVVGYARLLRRRWGVPIAPRTRHGGPAARRVAANAIAATGACAVGAAWVAAAVSDGRLGPEWWLSVPLFGVGAVVQSRRWLVVTRWEH